MANETNGDPPPEKAPDPEPAAETKSTPAKADKRPGKDAGDSGDAERDAVGDDRSASEAYLRGRESLRSEGNTASAHKSKVKNLIGGNYHTTKIFADTGTKKTSGLVREKVLERIRATFAFVAGYERMRDTMRETRVIVVRGLPQTGMTTTAVRLLDEVTDGKVARLDLTSGITSIRERDLTKKHGYVVRLTTLGPHGGPTEVELDALAELLGKRKCWCIVLDTTGADHGGLGDYAFDYSPPHNDDVLRKHVEWRLADQADQLDDVLRLADDDMIVAAMGVQRTLADVVRLAELLVQHARGRLEFDDVVAGCAGLVADQMTSWFACLRHMAPSGKNNKNDSAALAAFRIALAVLNISSYHQVVEAAQQLEALMVAEIDRSDAKGPLASVSLDRHNALTMSRAHAFPGVVTYGVDAVVNGELVRYLDDRFPIAVLDHVWSEYHWVRAPMVTWLSGLGEAESPIIWVRAAQAAGALTSIDFHYGYHRLVGPNVIAETTQQRRFAAIALDQASQDERSHDIVAAFLRRWRRSGSEEARWTAAATHGFGQGLDDIDATLDALRVLGTPDESLDALEGPYRKGIMITVVSRSLSSLLAFGAVEPILSTLNTWANHERTSMRTLARETVLRLVKQRGFHFTYLDVSGGRNYRGQLPRHERWPLLLALQHGDPSLADPIATLLRTVLRGNSGEEVADSFRSWITISQRDPACLTALEEFLPLLVEVPSDAGRLIHLVTMLRREWADPLRADVADAVETALRSATTREVNRWTTATMS